LEVQYYKNSHLIKNKTVQDILAEYRTLPEKSFQINYNIKLNRDGTVFDRQLKSSYNSLKHWAKEVISLHSR